MNSRANAKFRIKSWDEKPFSETEGGPKLTRASVVKSYQGDMEGEGVLEYLMIYHTPKSATAYGLERFNGSIGQKSGTLVLEHTGKFENGLLTSKFTVIPNSGTKGLKGLQGEISFVSGDAEEYPIALDYEYAVESRSLF